VRGVLLGALLATAVLAIAIVDQDSGLRTWLRLRHDVGQSQARVDVLRSEVEGLEAQVVALREDSFAEERAIREVLGMARPGEVVFRFEDEPSADDWKVPVAPPLRSRR
jgi:cell division protein FtsB